MTNLSIAVTENYNPPVLEVNGVAPTPPVGYVTFSATADLVNSNLGTIYKSIIVTSAQLVDGVMEPVELVTTDSTDWVPVGGPPWYWEICEVFAGCNPNTWYAAIPSTLGANTTLSKLTRVTL